jgi:GTPase
MPRAAKSEPRASAISAAIGQGLPTVVLVGRVNAGKSTLFNRVASGARAITSAIPGTTRDLNFARASYDDRDFILIDSGGLELGGRERMSERVVREALAAVGVADVVVMLFDGRAGFTDADREALALIRDTGCPLIVAVNKIDQPKQEASASDFYASGAEKIFFLSSAHGNGVGELLEEIVARLPAKESKSIERPDLKIALIGRPNVGKSSLLNRLSGFERSIVDSTPGTTRDAIDAPLDYKGKRLLLIDTAGIRRKPRVEGELEQASVGRAIEVIRRADVLLLVIDATEGITDQDAKLAHLVDTNDRAMVLVCNKWDAAAKEGGKVAAFIRDAHHRFPFLEYATIVFTSALTGDGVRDIIPAALAAGESWAIRPRASRSFRISSATSPRTTSAFSRRAFARR